MPSRHVIVDGSNLATEGRSLPSLAQLDQAVREFLAENPGDAVTVVVDASFGHRIDPGEVRTFEEAEAAGELISPPAGAIGRGDAFLLRIAEKMGATVLSNDSFQEFHGEHDWLFEKGRLIGGKPVPGVGWIFMPRTPVRGQKSREVVKEAKRKKRDAAPVTAAATAAAASGAASADGTGLDLAASRSKGRGKKVDRAIARATEEAVEPKVGSQRRRKTGVPPADPVNEPLAFITFIAAHPLGAELVGKVAEFSSHGAFVEADGARCYLPLSAMASPPPRRAREVVAKGEERTFVVQALDPQRRGIELAIPGFAKIAGKPTDETVEAEIHPDAEEASDAVAVVAGNGAAPRRAAGPRKKPVKKAAAVAAPARTPAPGKKAAAKKVAAAKKGGGKKAAPAVAGAPAKAVGKKAAASPGEKVPAPPVKAAKKGAGGGVKKVAPPAKKAAPAGKAPAKAAPAEKAAAGKQVAATKKAASADKAPAAQKVPAAKKAPPAKKPAPAKVAAEKKAAPTKRAAAGAPPSGDR